MRCAFVRDERRALQLLKTSHLNAMIKWYSLVVGIEVQFRNDVAAWTTNDQANHRVAEG
jgi:hypothetical protein